MIRPPGNPLVASDSLAVLRGNLAPDGAVIKPPAAEPRLHKHSGPAVVFEDYDDMAARIDDPDLDVDETRCWCSGTPVHKGAPGMPEWGQLPIPKKLLARGVRDMVRISDARMSGRATARAFCTSRRSRPSADRSPWCRRRHDPPRRGRRDLSLGA